MNTSASSLLFLLFREGTNNQLSGRIIASWGSLFSQRVEGDEWKGEGEEGDSSAPEQKKAEPPQSPLLDYAFALSSFVQKDIEERIALEPTIKWLVIPVSVASILPVKIDYKVTFDGRNLSSAAGEFCG